jgi:pimeloyl-ACP methyl ester carboxylesterase
MKKGYIDGPDGQIHYWQTGKGEDILLVHQAAQSSDEYLGIAPLLVDAGYRVWAIDLPGHGKSDDPPHEYSLEEYTAATLCLMDAMHIEHLSMGGHHGGSSVCMDIASQQPERVKAIVLSGCGVRSPEETQALIDSIKGREEVAMDEAGEFLSGAWGRYQDFTSSTTGTRETFVPFVGSLNSKLRPYDAHHAILRWDRRQALADIKCPVLLIQGDKDVFVKRQDELCEMIPGSQRIVIEDAGPFMFFDRPDACASVIIDFLRAA